MIKGVRREEEGGEAGGWGCGEDGAVQVKEIRDGGRCRRRGSHAVGHAGPITKTLSARQWPYQPAFHTSLINWEDWEEDGRAAGGGERVRPCNQAAKMSAAGTGSPPHRSPLDQSEDEDQCVKKTTQS